MAETEYLTIKEAAERLGLSERTVMRYMYERTEPSLKYRHFGRTPVIDEQDLEDFVKEARDKHVLIKVTFND